MRLTKAFWAAGSVALATACGGGSGGGLSVSTHAVAAAGTATATGVALPDGITVERIRMAIREVSVEGGDACRGGGQAATPAGGGTGAPAPMSAALDPSPGGSTDGSHDAADASDDDGCRLAFGPFDVDLAGSALSGAVSWAFDAPVPAGTYEEIEVKVNTVPAARAGLDPVLAALAAMDPPASIVVDGWVDAGTSTARRFSFAAPIEVEQEREGKISIAAGGSNVTLDFDPSHWFDAGDRRLDPASATDRGNILENIRSSIRLVKDDDHDGCDDDPSLATSGCHDGAGHR